MAGGLDRDRIAHRYPLDQEREEAKAESRSECWQRRASRQSASCALSDALPGCRLVAVIRPVVVSPYFLSRPANLATRTTWKRVKKGLSA